MTRSLLAVASLVAAGFAWIVTTGGLERGARAERGKPSIADFMQVVHGPGGLRVQLQESLAGSGPADENAWKTVAARASVIAFLTEAVLAGSRPRKGDLPSWKAKVEAYGQTVSKLASAAAKRDLPAAKEQSAELAKSCRDCHKAHK